MPPFINLFTRILTTLRSVVAASAALRHPNPDLAERVRARAEMLARAWSYLGRTIARFERLATLWHSGALPKPRAPRPARARTGSSTPRLPTARAWLVVTVGYQAANHASQLEHFLARPDLQPLLREAPQAGRLLRPLCRLLGLAPPPLLTLPPRPPRQKPARPPRPEPPPDRPLPAYVRAAVRAWKPRHG
ncbi:MAG: hypothetical protein IT555_05475 [Acetobacteraceae bacterium]|nr:hypothetical protein [Acetobacteraceae bacterium]